MVGYAVKRMPLTVNPGDRIIKEFQTIEEKAKQLAVNAPDIAVDYIQVPTYFIVNYPNGETKALHHVRDAKAISDAIRQMRFDEEDGYETSGRRQHSANLTPLILMLLLCLMTTTILIGIF